MNRVILCGKNSDGCKFFYQRDAKDYTSSATALNGVLFEIGPGDGLRVLGEGYLLGEAGRVSIARKAPYRVDGLGPGGWTEVGDGDYVTEEA